MCRGMGHLRIETDGTKHVECKGPCQKSKRYAGESYRRYMFHFMLHPIDTRGSTQLRRINGISEIADRVNVVQKRVRVGPGTALILLLSRASRRGRSIVLLPKILPLRVVESTIGASNEGPGSVILGAFDGDIPGRDKTHKCSEFVQDQGVVQFLGFEKLCSIVSRNIIPDYLRSFRHDFEDACLESKAALIRLQEIALRGCKSTSKF